MIEMILTIGIFLYRAYYGMLAFLGDILVLIDNSRVKKQDRFYIKLNKLYGDINNWPSEKVDKYFSIPSFGYTPKPDTIERANFLGLPDAYASFKVNKAIYNLFGEISQEEILDLRAFYYNYSMFRILLNKKYRQDENILQYYKNKLEELNKEMGI